MSALKMELEQLRKDNAKLQEMLKSTKEYADFGNFVADSGGRAIRLPSAQKEKKNFEDDKSDWVPQDAFSMAHNFRAQHGNDLSSDLINQLLQDLNNLWRQREKKQLARMKQKHQEEMKQMRRQLGARVPFDEVQRRKQIGRLQAELNAVRQELGKSQA